MVQSITILNVVGARPNFMKIAPIMEAYRSFPRINPILIHTGQHYDEKMSDLFFHQLGIPEPDINLEVGSDTRVVQTAKIMQAFEPVVKQFQPRAVVVVGDVNSTVACGLVAVDHGATLVHVEAGLRSNDRSMPEEINRILTDSISHHLFCTEQSGVDNLLREGVAPEKIHLVGNVMVDTLLKNRTRAESTPILESLQLNEGGYFVLTLHRPSNVDDPVTFQGILEAMEQIQREFPIIFPIHPRTRKRLHEGPLGGRLEAMKGFRVVEPLGYLEFLKLMSHAKAVMTDSGGIQEETTILKVPCLTLRHNTERPVTCTLGTNQLVGTDPGKILKAVEGLDNQPNKESKIPPLWDGKAAMRVVEILNRVLV